MTCIVKNVHLPLTVTDAGIMMSYRKFLYQPGLMSGLKIQL